MGKILHCIKCHLGVSPQEAEKQSGLGTAEVLGSLKRRKEMEQRRLSQLEWEGH